jgi:5-hydroxyisourate hydrolase
VSTISTHVLDTSLGKPAVGVHVSLERADGKMLGSATTNADGRVKEFNPPVGSLVTGVYRLRFSVGEYFAATKRPTFYDVIPVEFRVTEVSGHHHVPLLVSPFGYSTYRGS